MGGGWRGGRGLEKGERVGEGGNFISVSNLRVSSYSNVVMKFYSIIHLCILLQVEELRTVSQEEVCQWLLRYTHPGKHYRKLSVEV